MSVADALLKLRPHQHGEQQLRVLKVCDELATHKAQRALPPRQRCQTPLLYPTVNASAIAWRSCVNGLVSPARLAVRNSSGPCAD